MATITPLFRVSFPNVFKPKLNEMSNKQEYSLDAIFDGEAAKELDALLKAAAREMWGDKAGEYMKQDNFKYALKKGNAKKDVTRYPEYKDKFFITMRSELPPQIVDRQRHPIITTQYPDGFYAGCTARASVNIKPFEYKNKNGAVMNRGISVWLNGLQKVQNTEPLGAHFDASKDFDAFEDDSESADSYESQNDEFFDN